MSVVIPDDVIYATRMSASEIMQEVAVTLFQRDKLTIGQASRLAAMGRAQFQLLLASRQIPIHYDIADFDADLRTLKDMGRL
jgi:predicted HTH domain antitoxin